MEVKLKWITPEAEKEIVEIARVSSNRSDKQEDPVPLINYMLKHKHWSPFEMVNICIDITTSRAIGRQILRHRSFSFQEFSQRYAAVTAFEPIELRAKASKNRQSSEEVINPELWGIPANVLVDEFIESADQLYNKLLEEGVAKECARMVLPACAQTRMYMNGTLRSWIHFISLRDEEHAQKESQEIAKLIKGIIIKELPLVSKALNWV